ncbi:MAG: hypothetical protein KDK30_01195 [Leptospiraceae bacterium]|nr:hypothetical protein [Leptospiraceae bacterium]MCB1315084.1 hypothetical protein [Leptospiraceae bacterium]
MIQKNKAITAGPMMSAPGIRFRGKVFAFYYNNSMVFRLGRDFDATGARLTDYTLLNPFKHKPPMRDWFVVGYSQHKRWPELANLACQRMQT